MNNITKLNEVNGVKFLTYTRLEEIPFIKHAFSTKEGGVSEGVFSTLNLSFTRGDDEEKVKENYTRFFNSVGLTLNNMVMSDQIHEVDVLKIDEEKMALLSDDMVNRRFKNVDGMITNLKNVPLVTFYADCVPLYFIDMKNKAIGMSHSGWRGTVKGMGLKTVEALTKEYGTDPKDIVAVVGPSICRECYEVSKDVVDEFHKAYDGMFDVTKIYDITSEEKRQLDLWEANKQILMLAGIKAENIIISSVCTSCNDKLLYSHRKTGGKRGNLVAVMELI